MARREVAGVNGQSLSHKTTVQAAVRMLDLSAGREMAGTRVVSSFSGQAVAVPSAVAFIGSGDYFLDVYSASSDFKVLQYNERGVVAERALCSLPSGPSGVAITRDGQTAFFNCQWARSVARFSLVDAREPALVQTVRICEEPWDERRLKGAKLFHETRDTRMTANRWVSCGVCHLDGGSISDGLVWDLTTSPGKPKLGNTMDLINVHGSTPPYFHRGSPEVAEDLQRFVEYFHQGLGFEAPEWAAIVAYVNGLRARPNPHVEGDGPRREIRASAERGRKLFLDPARQCVKCHTGPALTVSGQEREESVFDVGTGKPIKTLSLLELWDTARYLHDGRAATLFEVLTAHNQGDRHGRTSDLSPGQLNDLVSYMLAPY